MDIYEKYKTIEDLPVKSMIIAPTAGVPMKGVMHFVHGMCEYKERYTKTMEFFANEGYVCFISDMRGHGENVEYLKDLGYFGEGGMDILIEDLHAQHVFLKNNYPDLPIIMVAHSMGTIITRAFIKRYDRDVDFVFLSGAPYNNFGKYPGYITAEFIKLIKDDTVHSDFIYKTGFKVYEKKFKGEGKNCWLCTDKEVVDKYNNDEKCDFTFTVNAYSVLFKLLMDIFSKKGYKVDNSKLPIYFIAGEEDPCIGGREKFKDEMIFMKNVGYETIKGHLFKGMRHEIFNEKDREMVLKYMLEKLKKFGY